MRGFLIGLIMLLFLVGSVLSLRPGGLRNQLRNIGRRLKIALLLGGAYLVASAVLRLTVQDPNASTWATIAVALVLGLVFAFLAQERRLTP
jgi:threonine/homoserine/homoserine lactone efflux protein